MTEQEFNELTKQWLNKEQVKEMSKFAKENGKTIYSISRLSTYTNCKMDYYQTYVLGNYGGENIYSKNGGDIHEHLEKIYKGEETVEQMQKEYPKQMALNKLFYPFPNDSIGNSWESDMLDFVKNFKKKDYYKTYQERGFVINLGDDTKPFLLQGWIDLTIENEDGGFDIVDYKTSSMYTGESIREHAMQLLLYAFALKTIEGKYPNSVSWFFLKYWSVTDKNGRKKEQVPINRGRYVKELSSKIQTHLKKLCVDDSMLLNMSIRNNTLELLPQEIQDRFILEDCFVSYPITYETINDMYDYITDTIVEIEARDKSNSRLWLPDKKSKDFFCNNLCSNCDRCSLGAR